LLTVACYKDNSRIHAVFAGDDMSKELSIHKIVKGNSAFSNEGRGDDKKTKNNVYDFELEIIKRKRDEAIRKILEDSKLLKW